MQRLEGVLSLACLGLALRRNAIDELHNGARRARASHEDSHQLAGSSHRDAADLLASVNNKIFPGLEHLDLPVVNVNENLVAAIDSDHVCVLVAIHVSERLQMAEVRHLAHPNVHLIEAFRRGELEELGAKHGHVE